MVLCYHLKCIEEDKPPVRLANACSIHSYLLHLASHDDDEIGKAMFVRFSAMYSNTFCEEYDSISPSPYTMLNQWPGLKEGIVDYMKAFAIKRDFNQTMNYTCHWKNLLIKTNLTSSQSLTFREDDAMVAMVLNYPEPIKRWAFWDTLSVYSLKLVTSISSTALNLYRGITDYQRLYGNENNLQNFVRAINHPE